VSAFVVDASVVAKWFLNEPHAQEARRLLSGVHALHAPDFLQLELDSLLWKHVRRQEMTRSDADAIRSAVRAFPVQLHPWAAFMDAAFEIAVQEDRSVYDSLYVALSVLLGGRLVTADRRLVNALRGGAFEGSVLWIEDAV